MTSIERSNKLDSVLAELTEYVFASGDILQYNKTELLEYQKDIKCYALIIDKLMPLHED